MPSKISLIEKFQQFSDEWSPRIIAEANGQLLKLAKASGEFVWHKHDDDDEVFIVFKGRITIQFRDHNVELGPGEMCVVPKGIEHCPVAEPGTEIMLIEPATTKHTGTVNSEKTVAVEDQNWI